VLLVEETHAKSGRSLLLDLPEKHASTYFGSRLPDVRGQGRVQASELGLQSGLTCCRIHAFSEWIRLPEHQRVSEAEIMRVSALLHQGLQALLSPQPLGRGFAPLKSTPPPFGKREYASSHLDAVAI